jgi:hypothetical protein
MGWRKTQAQVASGEKSFVPKDDSFEQGFAKFADIVSTKMMSDAKAKRDEEKADRDYITEQTRLADEKDKEHQKKATAALEQANLDPTNTKLFNKAFTMAQGGQTIENIFSYFDSGIKAGTIELGYEKAGPMPGTATNPVIAKYESGSGGANALLNQAQNGQFSDIKVSTMPIGEVMAFQGRRGEGSYHAWSKANMPKNTQAYRSGMGSTPVGTYQFVGETLQELKRNGTFEALGITDATVFDEQTQEKLFVRYAQDSLKGKTDPAERREALRSKWEGLKNASDEEVDSVIASIETGTFAGADALTEVDRDAPGFDMAADVKFKAPKEEFDEIDISKILTAADWEAADANLKANPKRLRPEFQAIFEARGENLKLLQKTNKVEDLFSIDLITADTMTAQKLQERINLAEAKEITVPKEVKNYVAILEGRSEYSDKDILSMSAAERSLVAKFAKTPKTREFALRVNQNDVEAFAWISQASSNSESAKAKAKEFFAAGDLKNFNLASNIARSLEKGELPYKELIKIDNLVGKSLTDLRSIKRLATEGGATPEELTSLQGELDRAIQLETNGEYRKYAEKATTLKTASAQLSIAIREGASIETISGLKQLEATLRKQEETKADIDKFGFAVIPEDAVITLADGTLKYSTVYRKPGVEGFTNRAGETVNAMPMAPLELDAYKTIRTETQKIGNELALANVAITEGMRTSLSAIELVRADERVKGAGGAVAGFIRNTVAGGGELFSVAEELFKNQDTITIEDLQKDTRFSNEILDAVVSGDVQNLANQTARFQAKMLSLAFQVGRMEGQSGNAMSNQDFRKIMEIVSTAGGAEAFEKNLIEYMGSKIKSYDGKALGFVKINTNVSTFVNDYGYLPIAQPLTFKEFVEIRNEPSLTSAFNLFTGTQTEPTTIPPKPQSSDGLPAPTSKAERDALSNTWYVTPDGSLAWKGT